MRANTNINARSSGRRQPVTAVKTLPRLATVAEVEPLFVREAGARKLIGDISREMLWKLRRGGHIEAVKYGAATLYPVESLKAFADKLRADGSLAPVA
jgi:hypothetical protein